MIDNNVNLSRKRKLLRMCEKGFSLVEMLIVISLIALIGTFVTTNVINKYNRSKVDATKIQMKQLGVILDDFRRECGFYPDSNQGLEALVKPPVGGRECRNYDPDGYIKGGKVPKDGFGYDFGFESDGNRYVLKSLGNDNREGGDGIDKDILSNEID